jgi:hypothetical protein
MVCLVHSSVYDGVDNAVHFLIYLDHDKSNKEKRIIRQRLPSRDGFDATTIINRGTIIMTKSELRVLMAKQIESYVAKGGQVTPTKSRKPRKAELLNVVTAFAAGGRWYRGGVASSNDIRYMSNNTA